MKFKKITSLVIVCIIAISAGALVVKAENATTTSVRKVLPAIKNNFEKNDVRNIMVQQKEVIKDIRASTTEKIREIKASTTMMFKTLKNERREIVRKMRVDTFQIRKAALEKELRTSLTNLTRTREQISERITKAEGAGRNMTNAKAALVIADEKLAKATIAINAFASTTFISSTSTTSTSTEISLDKPRKLGDEAIKAVKIARDSLKTVVQAIAHSMGLKIGVNGKVSAASATSTTATSTTIIVTPSATPTPVTATTTSTTTTTVATSTATTTAI